MTNQTSNSPNGQTKYDLEDRTKKFSSDLIILCKNIHQDAITRPIIGQLVRSGTSIGANYCEANETNSKKDFYYKINIAKKEAKETMYWLKIVEDLHHDQNEIQLLHKEAHEFVLMFSSILNKK